MARRKNPDDRPEENTDSNTGSDDTFGLPEIEYQPIKRDSESPPPEPPREEVRASAPTPEYKEEQPVTNTSMERDEVRQSEQNTTYYDEDEERSPWPKILGITALVLIIGAAGWYFGYKKPNDAAAARERAAQEEQARAEASRIADERAAERLRAEEENRRRADSLANATPAVGTIETLSSRTGRYYVVVASAIDGDLLMDYAKELSGKGINPKIIQPYGNVKFHRLTVAEGETFASAQQTADQLKSEYSDAVWVIKY